jgi:hypothetical protein
MMKAAGMKTVSEVRLPTDIVDDCERAYERAAVTDGPAHYAQEVVCATVSKASKAGTSISEGTVIALPASNSPDLQPQPRGKP